MFEVPACVRGLVKNAEGCDQSLNRSESSEGVSDEGFGGIDEDMLFQKTFSITAVSVSSFSRVLGIQHGIAWFKRFWLRGVPGILLAGMFTNIGASLGTFVAIILMVKVLA